MEQLLMSLYTSLRFGIIILKEGAYSLLILQYKFRSYSFDILRNNTVFYIRFVSAKVLYVSDNVRVQKL